MGKKLDKYRHENFENMKVGFLLELGFRQNSISEQLRNFIIFIESNENFLNKIDLSCMTQGIDNFIDLFYNFTDLVFKDVDFNEIHCKYHKDFY